MSTAKIIEVISEGKTVDDAVNNGVKDAAKTVKGIKAVYVKEIQGIVEKQKVVSFRTTLKITFVVDKEK